MLSGANILCFAKDWTEDPTSNNYVMRMLARHNKVLWLNSIATRAPSARSSSDMQKIVRKLRSFTDGAREVEPGLSVFTPIVLPFPHSDVAVALNRRILHATTWALRQRLGMRDFQLWSFLPTAAPYAGALGESLVVYYITDEFSQFTSVDGARVAKLEEQLLARADIVFATSQLLVDRKRRWNPEVHLASHGVDQAHFARALDDELALPADIAQLPEPRIGFFGLVEDWIDIDLMGAVAEKHPDWSIVMIGKVKVDKSRLDKYKNIHWLGRKPYAELPAYCKGWQVATMPFAMNELTKNVNPIKLREYLSAGLPVVSTDLPDCRHYPEDCFVAHDRAEWVALCEKAVAENTPEKRRRRSEAMKAETWEKKVEQLGDQVKRVLNGRGR
jgi:glycosyltransferase involved in cell wall biosynthesis